ncbi:hypothetical protein RSJ22_00470 (plasmid) [Clostridium botulinum]|uniref:hypothetical protein n=1 Tax=Clostridium botulinum TaxID=1491 RepID=UPI000C755CD2|nr:hypothetical protein [Clostridium botulinum]AUN20004.1 hypothetical protein RSJ22_00470 [Clostridium botulinum]
MLHFHEYKLLGVYYNVGYSIYASHFRVCTYKRLLCMKCGKVKDIKIQSTLTGGKDLTKAYINSLIKNNILNFIEMDSKTIKEIANQL